MSWIANNRCCAMPGCFVIMVRSLWLGILTVGITGTSVFGQEDVDKPSKSKSVEVAAKLSNFKQAVRKIEQLRSDFQMADKAGREEIGDQLAEYVTKAEAALQSMIDEAVKAYRAQPEGDSQVTKLLLSVAQHDTTGRALDKEGNYRDGGDRYEKAMPIVQALLEGGADLPDVPLWGFVCAFVANDYDLAEKYLELAKERGALKDPRSIEEPAQKSFMESAWKYATLMDTYRELWATEQEIRTAEATADDLPRVKLTTNKGDVVLELFENDAPIAVANFITLVKKGYYDGLTFHRVLPGFMAQGGCPKGDGTGGPGYQIGCECHQEGFRRHFRGSISMAHAGRDTGGSQFFLTFVPTEHLDGRHTVFGRVIEGIEVLGELQLRSPASPGGGVLALPDPDLIIKAEVVRDRGHDYDFPKLPNR